MTPYGGRLLLVSFFHMFHGAAMSRLVKQIMLPRVFPGLLSVVMILSSCSSSKPVSTVDTSLTPAEQSYHHAVELISKKNYDVAIMSLESLMFSTRATTLEDDVLNTLADAYFRSEQYMMSADAYRRLLQQTPNSPYARNAQFQLARSYEKLSPFYELDQEYTYKAISEFSVYLDQYPEDETAQLSKEAELYRELMKVNPSNLSYKAKYEAAMAELANGSPVQYIKTAIPVLREKLAHNRYSIARQYVKLKKYKSAEIFFSEITSQYADTKWAEPAWAGKIDMQIERGKWFEARQSIERFKELFPDKVALIDGAHKKVLAYFSDARKSDMQQ
jgi:outer membrane protein assembly factor BamD